MKKEIFVALNEFEVPNHLANYGAHLAKSLNRSAFLFGVTKVPLQTPPVLVTGDAIQSSVATNLKDLEEMADRSLKAVADDAGKIYPNISYNTGIGFNEPTIVSKTEKEDPYLVVLERKNELTTLHEWFGTYETRLVESITSPTLVVPETCSWKPVNNILYIMDMDDQKVSNMRYLADLIKELNAQLTVVTISDGSINDDDQRYITVTNTLRELLGYTDIPFHRIFADDPSDTVEKLMKQINADWLAFEHKSRSFLERILDDYNTKHLILQSEKPVLVF